MNTPIYDFIKNYIKKGPLRLHMPGHKGKKVLGCEKFDITEIPGADSLYEADSIIKQSEQNATAVFGTPTFYSTEGSTHAICAMMFLCKSYAKEKGLSPLVWAARNAHKAFVSACAKNDLEIEWLYAKNENSVLSCKIDADDLDDKLTLAPAKPMALYITSPDYLGNISDVEGIAKVCRKHDILFCVDCAHGAYLKFLPNSLHPSDLGADMVCSSAHKTLDVLTGGAYLHMGSSFYDFAKDRVKGALSFFGSSSPSYLILASLDCANRRLAEHYPKKLLSFVKKAESLKKDLSFCGYTLVGDEALKLTLDAGSYGYTGYEMAKLLHKENIVCEFSDPDYIVMMLSPSLGDKDIKKLKKALLSIPKKPELKKETFSVFPAKKALGYKESLFLSHETIDINLACGRILAGDNISCPPAVPIVMSGEIISDEAIRCMEYYGIKKCRVIK